jgi:hypothetical protein
MKKISKEDYNEIRADFNYGVSKGLLPSFKQQVRSKKRREFYQDKAFFLNCYEGTIRRVVKSKNYAEYLRLGRENRGNSTKRKEPTYSATTNWSPTNSSDYVYVDTNSYKSKPKPKKYKTTIVSTKPFIIGQQRFDLANENGELLSYTVEVIND